MCRSSDTYWMDAPSDQTAIYEGARIFNSIILPSERQQHLSRRLPSLASVAAQIRFRICVVGDDEGCDDQAQLFSKSEAHNPANGLNNVNNAFARFNERHCRKRRTVSFVPEQAYVQDGLWDGTSCVTELAQCFLALDLPELTSRCVYLALRGSCLHSLSFQYSL